MEQGLVQVYTGKGKGKTTAATGLVVRALGQGMRVLLVRFLKPSEPASGEILFLQGAEGLEVLTAGVGIIYGTSPAAEVRKSVLETWEQALSRMESETWDLVVFDEINNALHRKYLPLEKALTLVDEKPGGTELVFTGRYAPPELMEKADLVTSMEMVRHPMAEGVPARRGIEF